MPPKQPPKNKPAPAPKKAKMPVVPKSGSSAPARVAKKFSVQKYDGVRGKVFMCYAESGMGKTTCAALAPKPVFIGLDHGAERVQHPITGDDLDGVPGIEDFQDVLDVMDQPDIFKGYETIVLDHATLLEDWATAFAVATIPTDKGYKVKNILGYGWGKGASHVYDLMNSVITRIHKLANAGYNVIVLAQNNNDRVPNPQGEDFLREGARLQTGKYPIQSLFYENMDHVFRIAYLNRFATEDGKAVGTTTRAIFTQPEVHFFAKTSSIDEPVVSFADKTDDSLWQFLFGGE